MTLLNLVKMQLLDQNKTLSHLSFYTLGVGMSQHQQHSKCTHLSWVINSIPTQAILLNSSNRKLYIAWCISHCSYESRYKTMCDNQIKNKTMFDHQFKNENHILSSNQEWYLGQCNTCQMFDQIESKSKTSSNQEWYLATMHVPSSSPPVADCPRFRSLAAQMLLQPRCQELWCCCSQAARQRQPCTELQWAQLHCTALGNRTTLSNCAALHCNCTVHSEQCPVLQNSPAAVHCTDNVQWNHY